MWDELNNNMSDTAFKPTEIKDQPIPLLNGDFSQPTGITDNHSDPATVSDTPIPHAITASEVISTSLNTETKKILASFNFEKLGAIVIGQISISPTGILGKDLSGNTTFSLDPDTGAATFSGTVTAGSFIGGNININSTFIVDSSGNVTANSITITGGSISGVSLNIGSSSAFHVDTGGDIWIGGTTFNNATWRVSNVGAMDAGTSSFMSGHLIIDTGHTISYNQNSGSLNISTSGADIRLNAFGGNILLVGNTNLGSMNLTSDLSINGKAVSNIGYQQFNTNSNQGGDGTFWLYNAGGSTRYWRSRAGGFNGQFQQTGF